MVDGLGDVAAKVVDAPACRLVVTLRDGEHGYWLPGYVEWRAAEDDRRALLAAREAWDQWMTNPSEQRAPEETYTLADGTEVWVHEVVDARIYALADARPGLRSQNVVQVSGGEVGAVAPVESVGTVHIR